MSLMQKITDICKAHPNGINVNELAAMCPEVTRDQVIVGARNAHARAKIARLSESGFGQATHSAPTVYGPPLPDQLPFSCVAKNDARKNAQRQAVKPKKPSKLFRGRMPVNSVWGLGS